MTEILSITFCWSFLSIPLDHRHLQQLRFQTISLPNRKNKGREYYLLWTFVDGSSKDKVGYGGYIEVSSENLVLHKITRRIHTVINVTLFYFWIFLHFCKQHMKIFHVAILFKRTTQWPAVSTVFTYFLASGYALYAQSQRLDIQTLTAPDFHGKVIKLRHVTRRVQIKLRAQKNRSSVSIATVQKVPGYLHALSGRIFADKNN